jgi:thiosulfate dehydrogenase [quinone] large subunit
MKEKYIWASLRIALGWIMLWPLLDKLFGLGFATTAEKAWLTGASPTLGFLKSSSEFLLRFIRV